MKQEVNKMDNTNKKDDRSTWAIGGGLLLGMGVGFFFLKESVLAFVGSMFIGLGLGLMITSIISRVKKKWVFSQSSG
jgi:predicted lipid-binding transport protein (Tim44 family)